MKTGFMTAREMGRKGGKARMKSLSSAQRSELARRGAEARWAAKNQRLALAREAFRRFHSRCFWYADPKLEIATGDLSFVADGLRKYGGREEYLVAAGFDPRNPAS